MPAVAGAPRCEKPELWFWYSELARRILPRPTPIPAGDKPPRYIFSFRHRPSVYNSARFAGGEPASRLIEGRESVFIAAIAHAGCCRRTKV